jgi:hypothetical protein
MVKEIGFLIAQLTNEVVLDPWMLEYLEKWGTLQRMMDGPWPASTNSACLLQAVIYIERCHSLELQVCATSPSRVRLTNLFICYGLKMLVGRFCNDPKLLLFLFPWMSLLCRFPLHIFSFHSMSTYKFEGMKVIVSKGLKYSLSYN